MRYFLLFILVIAAFWLGIYSFEHVQDVTIKWGDWLSITLTSTTLILAGIVSLLALYLLVLLLRTLFNVRKRLREKHQLKLTNMAKQDLIQGLVHFTEGHWQQAEKLLLQHIEHSEAPLINYLAAARAAHMQEAYARRDAYLKKASQQGDDAHIPVAISQAEMQFTGGQIEQARATLIHLREVAPEHPYVNKLLAKVYYKQEDWSNLFELLPALGKLDLISDSDRQKYEVTALKGIFQTLARKKDSAKLHLLWKKLPNDIRNKPQAVLLYCESLSESGDTTGSDKLLVSTLNREWDEQLAERYGLIEHDKLGTAIKLAEKWLNEHPNSPMLLLTLARLHRKYKLWGKSKTYYTTSLNTAPSAGVYLELAELLEELGETENAELCYRSGLRYSIYRKGEMLNLKSVNSDKSATLAVVPENDQDVYSV